MNKLTRGLVGALGAVLLASACGDSDVPLNDPLPDTTAETSQGLTTVTLKWTSASPTASPYLAIAPRSDGSAIAAMHDAVVAFSPAGVRTTLLGGAKGRPIVQRGVEGFVVPGPKGAEIFDATGARKASVPLAVNEYARLIPGSLQLFAPRSQSGDPENSPVDQGRIFSEMGAQTASFSATNLVQSRTTSKYVLWATRSGMRKTTLAGTPVWSSSAIVPHQFETDDAGRFLIVNRTGDTRVVELYDNTTRLGASTFESPIWNIAISPAGQFAAANSKGIARVFNAGRLVGSVQLDRVMPVSLDVSNQGNVLIGTQDRAKKVTAVTLYSSTGAVLWSKTFADDTNAYRPDIRFTPDGKGFFVRDQSGISFYALGGV